MRAIVSRPEPEPPKQEEKTSSSRPENPGGFQTLPSGGHIRADGTRVVRTVVFLPVDKKKELQRRAVEADKSISQYIEDELGL